MKSIGLSGFASDGAWHIESDGNKAGKITWDRTRKRPAIVIHDWPLMSGGTPDKHLIGYWKMDDNAASTVVIDETGNHDGTLVGGDNTEDIDSTDAVRGTSLLLDGSADKLDFSTALAGLQNGNCTQFTIQIKFKPNFAYTIGSSQGLFIIGSGTSDQIYLLYHSSDYFSIWSNVGGDNDYCLTRLFSSDLDLQQWRTVIISVDIDQQCIYFWFPGVTNQTNSQDFIRIPITNSAWTAPPDVLWIGDTYEDYYPGAYHIDEVKLYDACILPYGAYHIGNGAGLLADIDNPHSDLIFFWDCQSTAAKHGSGLGTNETGSILANGEFNIGATLVGTNGYDNIDTNSNISFVQSSNGDLLDPDEGAIGIWFNIQTVVAGDFLFGVGPDASNYIRISLQGSASNYYLAYDYMAGGVEESVDTPAGSIEDAGGIWHFALCTWSQSAKEIHMWFNGVYIGSDTIANIFAGTALSLYMCASFTGTARLDAFIGRVFITNNPNTPEIWTNFGKPLWLPLVRDE